MATRVGKYCWEIDMDEMDSEELTALHDLCDYYLEMQKRTELNEELLNLIKKIHNNGFNIKMVNEDYTYTTIIPSMCFLEKRSAKGE